MRITDGVDIEVVTLTEALKRLADADKKDLYVRLEKYERGKYIIPMNFVPMIVGTQAQGKVYERESGGKTAKTVVDLLAPLEGVEAGAFTWAGASGAINGATVTSVGYKTLIFYCINPTWAGAPTTMNLQIELSDNGLDWFTARAADVSVMDPANDAQYYLAYIFTVAAGDARPMGELAQYWRPVITTVGGAANGTVIVRWAGVSE